MITTSPSIYSVIFLARHTYFVVSDATLTGSNPATKALYLKKSGSIINANAPLLAAKINLAYRFNLKQIIANKDFFQDNALPLDSFAPVAQVTGLIQSFQVNIDSTDQDSISFLYAQLPDYFWTKYGQTFLLNLEELNRPFLSFAPNLKKIKSNTQHFLYYLNSLLVTPTSLKLKAKIWTFGKPESTTITVSTQAQTALNDIYCFAVDLHTIIANTGYYSEDIAKYQVFVTDQNDAIITQTKTFIIDDSFQEDTISLMWRNALGVFETFDFDGQASISNDYTYQQFQTETEMIDYDTDIVEKLTVRTSAIDAEWLNHFGSDLLLSNEIYWLNKGRKIRLAKTQKSLKIRDEKSAIDSAEMEFRIAKI